MTALSSTPAADLPHRVPAPAVRAVSVVLYSDDVAVRDAVRVGVGRRPAPDLEVRAWHECATAPAVIEWAESAAVDLILLDGEAAPVGGLGLCRQLKNEIHQCPPIIVLTGRPQDGWLASWSQAEAAVSQPLDPLALSQAMAAVLRAHPPRG